MAQVLTQQAYTIADLEVIAAQPENQDKHFELIEGEIYEKMGTRFIPSHIATLIIIAIGNYLRQNPIGYLTGADGSYRLSDHNKPMPDVGYISKERMPEIPTREVSMPPDLAVEVVSPTDDLREAQKKAMLYLRYGVKLVWVVYPEDETVDVYTPAETGAYIQNLTIEDMLTGGNVLPNFQLAVKDIFVV